jgi:hypothetical protein
METWLRMPRARLRASWVGSMPASRAAAPSPAASNPSGAPVSVGGWPADQLRPRMAEATASPASVFLIL